MTEPQPVTGKAFWESKTLWINLLAVVALAVQAQSTFVFDANMQAGLLCLINIGLRTITKDEIVW